MQGNKSGTITKPKSLRQQLGMQNDHSGFLVKQA